MSDLIERLRGIRGSFVIPIEAPNVFDWADEAADEIERLQARVEELEAVVDALVECKKAQKMYESIDYVPEWSNVEQKLAGLESDDG